MSDSELKVLRAFYAVVGAELDNWVDGASVRVLSRAHAMLRCAVEQPVPEPEPEQSSVWHYPEEPDPCSVKGHNHVVYTSWPASFTPRCGWCHKWLTKLGPIFQTHTQVSVERCPEGGVHRWGYGDDGHGHSGEFCGKCGVDEAEISSGFRCPEDEHQWTENGVGLVSCDVCPAVR